MRFSADEIGLEAFGYNIENRVLVAALEARAAEIANLTRLDEEAETVVPGDDEVTMSALGTIRERGTGATRQRAAFAQRTELADIVTDAVRRTCGF